MVVVYDDITLAPGNIRVRKKGSAGGHNGIKNIIAHTGTQNFMRVRVGVGEKPQGWDLADYVMGVEVGMDTNGRKARTGDAMEDLVEAYIVKAGFVRGKSYFKELTLSAIEKKWGIDLSNISNTGKTEKRFDFVIKTDRTIYGIETNFYNTQGSKPNETARSYKTIALEAKDVAGFKFVWFTDGKGWKPSRSNLEEAFEVMEHIYNIKDLENGIITEVFK